jgi:hypothetical protein
MKYGQARRVAMAATAYFAIVFAFAFMVGIVRVTVVAPKIGALAAVALEVPLVLGVSWLTAGRVLRRWPLSRPDRAKMGMLAFAILMVAELALAIFAFGQSPGSYFAGMVTPAGVLGLAGQIGFALVPVLRA